jgi:hypothetical protein
MKTRTGSPDPPKKCKCTQEKTVAEFKEDIYKNCTTVTRVLRFPKYQIIN